MKSRVIVNEAVGEIRKQPEHAAEQVSQVVLGTPLLVLGRRDGGRWLRVECPDGYRGWIRSWSVHPASAAQIATWQSGPMVEVDSLVARLREHPTSRSLALREAPLGAKLPRIGRSGNWLRVLLPDEIPGYLHSHDLLVDRAALRPRLRPRDIPSLLRTAHRFLGVPYQWGGVTAKGLDCSGLVQTVFRMHGVLLPRDAKDQFRWVRRESYIHRDPLEAQFGHLVFFGASDAAVSHVGICLRDGRFLHARGRVRINSLRAEDSDFDRDLSLLFRAAGPVLLQ
jgi:gamma-D-glutamyl-L-lysine dipeptidyl-peptidase